MKVDSRFFSSNLFIQCFLDSVLVAHIQTWKTTAIWRTAVQKTAVSRQSCVPNWDNPWNPSDHHNTDVLRGLRRAFNLVPIRLREDNLSDSRCEFFQSGHFINHGDSSPVFILLYVAFIFLHLLLTFTLSFCTDCHFRETIIDIILMYSHICSIYLLIVLFNCVFSKSLNSSGESDSVSLFLVQLTFYFFKRFG